MMQEHIKRERRRAILSALFHGFWTLFIAGLLLMLRWHYRLTGLPAVILLLVAGINVFSLIPLTVSLRHRLKEIQGGEEYEARHY